MNPKNGLLVIKMYKIHSIKIKTMKKLLVIILFSFIQFSSLSQTKFVISWNQGFANLPTYTPYDESNLLTMNEAQEIFNYVKYETKIEWRYSYAGCEKRAHAVSLLLKDKKIKHYKIWNFDPMLISFFNKSQNPTVNSMAGLSPTVSWAYHVAILVFVSIEGKVTPMVIDPALGDNILSQNKWLELQNAPNSYYTYLDPKWYNYASMDKVIPKCNNEKYPFPPCMTGLLTGDFYLNDGISLSQRWVEEALAVNELAMKIVQEIINRESKQSDKRKAFTKLVENFDKLTDALKNNILPDDIKPYAGSLKTYQTQFISIKNSWTIKLDSLREKY